MKVELDEREVAAVRTGLVLLSLYIAWGKVLPEVENCMSDTERVQPLSRTEIANLLHRLAVEVE